MGRGGNNRTQVFLVFVILSTIPCYLLGVGLWLFSPDNNAPAATSIPDTQATATWTPIDPNSLITLTPTDAIIVNTATPTVNDFQQVTATVFFPPTVTPTQTPTTFIPTVTPTHTPTPTPTEIQPVILPASDTPSP